MGPSGGQIWNQCKCYHLVTKFATNSSSASEIDLIYSSWKIYSSYEINTLGPLCLWQCYLIQICICWFVTNRFKIWSLCDVSCHIALECLFDKHMAHLHYSFKFGHEMLSLTYLATRWHHLRELQSWPPDGTTRISHKVVHQMAPLALVPNLTTRWCQLH